MCACITIRATPTHHLTSVSMYYIYHLFAYLTHSSQRFPKKARWFNPFILRSSSRNCRLDLKILLTITSKLRMILQNIWRRVVGNFLNNISPSSIFLTMLLPAAFHHLCFWRYNDSTILSVEVTFKNIWASRFYLLMKILSKYGLWGVSS